MYFHLSVLITTLAPSVFHGPRLKTGGSGLRIRSLIRMTTLILTSSPGSTRVGLQNPFPPANKKKKVITNWVVRLFICLSVCLMGQFPIKEKHFLYNVSNNNTSTLLPFCRYVIIYYSRRWLLSYQLFK